MDKISKKHRSWNMSQIKSENTTPERIVRSLLHKMGFRFRLHEKKLPGKPDIVLKKYRTVIFVHGCFWHRHARCKYAYIPKSHHKFWQKKFSENMVRDKNVKRILKKSGWKIITIWECQINNQKKLIERLTSFIQNTQ